MGAQTGGTDANGSGPSKRTFGLRQVLLFIAGLLIVVGIFAFAVPKFANYSAVWKALGTLSLLELTILFGVMIFNLFTYWMANQAALPGLGLGHAALLTQTGTSVANTLPAGGAIAVGVTFAMLGSWGFTPRRPACTWASPASGTSSPSSDSPWWRSRCWCSRVTSRPRWSAPPQWAWRPSPSP